VAPNRDGRLEIFIKSLQHEYVHGDVSTAPGAPVLLFSHAPSSFYLEALPLVLRLTNMHRTYVYARLRIICFVLPGQALKQRAEYQEKGQTSPGDFGTKGQGAGMSEPHTRLG